MAGRPVRHRAPARPRGRSTAWWSSTSATGARVPRGRTPPRWSAWAARRPTTTTGSTSTVTVTVGGEEVPFAELFVALAEGQSHLILPSGTYFSLDRRRAAPAGRAHRRGPGPRSTPTADGIRLSRFQASLWEDIQRLGVVTAQARAWEASVRALAEAADRTEYDGAGRPARHPPALPAGRVQLAGLPLRAPAGRRSWPTTWGWARPSRPWPSCATPRSGA